MKVTKKESIGRTYGGLSQEKRKAMRRQQFMDAGLEVFGTEGFRAATVRRLCREANLTDRYFYEAFGSTEALLMAVYEQCMDNIRDRIIEAITGTIPSNSISEVICAGLDRYFSELEDPRVARVCMVELVGISPEVDQLYNGYIIGFSDLLMGLAKQVYPHWQLSEDELQVFGISAIGALRQLATNWLLSDYRIDRKSLVNTSAKTFIGVVSLIEAEQSAN